MTPEMQFAQSLGLQNDELVEKTAAAFRQLSIDELMDVLRSENITTADVAHVTKTKEWRDLPAPEPEAHEKTAGVRAFAAKDGKVKKASAEELSQMAEMADAWGRQMARQDFAKLAAANSHETFIGRGLAGNAKTDTQRARRWGNINAAVMGGTGALLGAGGGVKGALLGGALGAATGYGAGRLGHWTMYGKATGKAIKNRPTTKEESKATGRRAAGVTLGAGALGTAGATGLMMAAAKKIRANPQWRRETGAILRAARKELGERPAAALRTFVKHPGKVTAGLGAATTLGAAAQNYLGGRMIHRMVRGKAEKEKKSSVGLELLQHFAKIAAEDEKKDTVVSRGAKGLAAGAAVGGAAGAGIGAATTHSRLKGALQTAKDLSGFRSHNFVTGESFDGVRNYRRVSGKYNKAMGKALTGGATKGALIGGGLGLAGGLAYHAHKKLQEKQREKTSSVGYQLLEHFEKVALSGLGQMMGGASRAILNSSAGRRAAVGAGIGAVGGAVAGGPDHRLSGALGGAALGAGAGLGAQKGLMAAGSMNNRVGSSIRKNLAGSINQGKTSDFVAHKAVRQMSANAAQARRAAQAPTA